MTRQLDLAFPVAGSDRFCQVPGTTEIGSGDPEPTTDKNVGSDRFPEPTGTCDNDNLPGRMFRALEPVPEGKGARNLVSTTISDGKDRFRKVPPTGDRNPGTCPSEPGPIDQREESRSRGSLLPSSVGHGGRDAAPILVGAESERTPEPHGTDRAQTGGEQAQQTSGTITLRPYQLAALEGVSRELAAGRKRVLIEMPTGCHRAGQLILMHDGSRRCVEDVVVGDRLMGPDGTPRTVLSLARGRQEMATIRPTKGEPWVVNLDHMLTLVRTPSGRRFPSDMGGSLVDVSVRDWMSWPRSRKHLHKLVRSAGVDFPVRPWPRIDPYVFGVLLGDGALRSGIAVTCKDREIWDACRAESARWGLRFIEVIPSNRCEGFRISSHSKGPNTNAMLSELGRLGVRLNAQHKHVPDEYRLNTADARLQLLAGLIDTDGHQRDGGYEFASSSDALADDVAFMARSVGLAAYVSTTQAGFRRVSISGDCSVIPCRVARKRCPSRRQLKSVLRTGFTVDLTGTVEDYYGFALDGDQRYLLGDFTVTHNTGKTRVFAEWARRCYGTDAAPTLVLAHRTELIDQAVDKLREIGMGVSIDQADQRGSRSSPVVVASVQTLRGPRLLRYAPNHFRRIVVDEAHHAAAASYQTILEHFVEATVLGVTATPDRADGKALGDVAGFEAVAFRYAMREAIADGWLAPVQARRVRVKDVDLTNVKSHHGDFDQGELARVLTAEGALHGMVTPIVELGGDRRTLVFGVDVAHAKALAEVLNRHKPGSAIAIDGSASKAERRATLALFRRGAFQYLVNCALFTEGFDEPTIACVAMCRPTQSRALYCQTIGRGTRLLGLSLAESIANGKRDVLVLDMVGNTRHRLVSPADALAGMMLDEAAHEAAEKQLEAGQTELEAVLTHAEAEAAAKLEATKLIALAVYRTKEIDVFLGDQMPKLVPNSPAMRGPATDAQLRAIEAWGMSPPPYGLSKGEASAMLDALAERKRLGLATVAQVRLLEQVKIDTRGMTKDRATQLILKGKAHNFKPWAFVHMPEYDGRRRRP